MHENTSISNQPQISPGAWNGKARNPAQHHDLEPELNEKLPIQLKLSVGAANDPLEYEADAMADKVMRMPETSFIQRKAECSCGDYDDEHVRLKPLASQVTPFIQTKSDGSSPVSDSVSGKIQSSKGGGSQMQGDTKSFMESRFGADFSDVKIHNNDESAQLNRSLNAKAFTVSNDIYFNSGHYQPETDSGKHLLAHELTHTIQQSGLKGVGSSAVIRRTPADDAKALAKKIHDAISAAKVDEGVVLTALETLGRDQTKAALLKTTYKTEHTTELEADIKLKMGAANVSRALFLLNALPAETSLVSEVTVDKVGTEDHKADVGGGKVSVHTGTDIKVGSTAYPGGFSIGYSGSKSKESRYIQTLWSEIISTQADKTETKVTKSGIGTTNGTMELTTDPTKPKYKIDSASATSPFYETGGVNIRTATGNTNYDRPSEFSDIILKQFDAGATKVVERDHFDNFLIQEEKVIYQVTLYVEWIYTSKTAIARSTKFVSGSAIATLPAEVKKQLVKEYPKFEYIS